MQKFNFDSTQISWSLVMFSSFSVYYCLLKLLQINSSLVKSGTIVSLLICPLISNFQQHLWEYYLFVTYKFMILYFHYELIL